MASKWTQRETAAETKPIPIHIVSFGHGIPYGDKVFPEADGHSYTTAPGYDALREALKPDSKTNVLFLNMAPPDYKSCLDQNEEYIRARNPLIVAPKDYRRQIPASLVEKYSIKFIPDEIPQNMANDIPPILLERTKQTAI